MTHRLSIRVYYEDTDMAGIVYHANYLRFIERGRSEMVREMGLDQTRMKLEDGVVFVVRRIEADYLGAAMLDDALDVVSKIAEVSPVRWVFHQEVHRHGKALFRARVEIVCMTTGGRLVRLPAKLRRLSER
ncbi:MAG: tol-pal system-associated acyl-CoA thioesterase [Pseudomonadota bacterium]